jgi:hypothetical protein
MALCILAGTRVALAHENHVYRIGAKTYQFTIGSLNEPVAVDDKTGLDFRVVEPSLSNAEGAPVDGLDQTLKVELAAGGQKRVFSIQPAFGQPGAYRTAFYPTVQTTLSYRIFGTIENIPLDLTFTCNPAGHPRSPDDNNEVKISDQVSRLSKRGAFGCPVAKADMGFPEAAPSAYDLQTKIGSLESALGDTRAAATRAVFFGLAGVVVGLAGAVFGAVAWKNGNRGAPRR